MQITGTEVCLMKDFVGWPSHPGVAAIVKAGRGAGP
jgi:hypothetical protein